MNLEEFKIDWNSIEEITEFPPLEAGKYAGKVIESKFKVTKKGDKMLMLTFNVLGTKRKLFENYMFTCKANPKTVDYALGKIKSLAKFLELDFDQLQDTSELHGKPVGIKLKITQSEQYGPGNSITSFFEYDGDLIKSPLEETKTEEITVEEPDIVEDETIEDTTVLTDTTPTEINAMKKTALINFIKADKELSHNIELKGKKLSQVKEAVIEFMCGSEIVDDSEDIIVED